MQASVSYPFWSIDISINTDADTEAVGPGLNPGCNWLK